MATSKAPRHRPAPATPSSPADTRGLKHLVPLVSSPAHRGIASLSVGSLHSGWAGADRFRFSGTDLGFTWQDGKQRTCQLIRGGFSIFPSGGGATCAAVRQ
jgi:hypothetical protein